MSRWPVGVVPALCMVFMAASQPASADDPKDVASCTISAWSTDKDPRGLNVRAGPGTKAPVVGRLPPPLEVEGETFATEVSITGSKDGWLRISRAMQNDYIWDVKTKVVFEGEGWVSGRYLGLLLNHGSLFGGPSLDSPVVATLSGTDADGNANGPDSFVVDRLRACRGDWVEVEGTFLGARLRGWAIGSCANQVTTCP